MTSPLREKICRIAYTVKYVSFDTECNMRIPVAATFDFSHFGICDSLQVLSGFVEDVVRASMPHERDIECPPMLDKGKEISATS